MSQMVRTMGRQVTIEVGRIYRAKRRAVPLRHRRNHAYRQTWLRLLWPWQRRVTHVETRKHGRSWAAVRRLQGYQLAWPDWCGETCPPGPCDLSDAHCGRAGGTLGECEWNDRG